MTNENLIQMTDTGLNYQHTIKYIMKSDMEVTEITQRDYILIFF